VIQSLHNYRLLCANGIFFRNNHICQKCLERGLWLSIYYGCWRKSRLITAGLVRGVIAQRKSERMINQYIVLSDFSRDRFIEGGVSAEKVKVKPNFIDFDPGERKNLGKYAIFVGTLRHYKGILTLLEAWRDIKEMPLKIVGDGWLHANLIKKYNSHNYINFLGRLPLKKTIDLIKDSSFVIAPSQCFENFPRVIIEAFACGVPVLASDAGSMKELVNDRINGLLFKSGDAADLREKAKYLINDQALNCALGKNARLTYEQNYTMEKNYKALMRIYEEVLKKI